eukprot:978201-Alexandrium_andersonii.AAC.1
MHAHARMHTCTRAYANAVTDTCMGAHVCTAGTLPTSTGTGTSSDSHIDTDIDTEAHAQMHTH